MPRPRRTPQRARVAPGLNAVAVAVALALLATVVAGCDRLFPYASRPADAGDDARDVGDTSAPDLRPNADTNSDANADAATLIPSFGPAQPVTPLNTTSSEDDPTLTADMTEIYFERSGDIYRAIRADVTAPWGAPEPVGELNSSDEDGTPDIAPDGLTLFFSSRRKAGNTGDIDIYISTRSSRADAWSAPQPVASLSSADDEVCAAPTADLLTVVLDSDRANPPDRDLYLSTRSSTGEDWATPVPITELNTTAKDCSGWINDALTLLFFGSERPAPAPFASSNIWFAARPSGQGAFGPAVVLADVSSADSESDPWLSPDLATIYFTRSPGAQGGQDIYVAHRP